MRAGASSAARDHIGRVPSRIPRASRHFVDRAEERALRPAVLSFILAWASEWRACGATHLTVLERHLPAPLRSSPLARAARDWILVLADDGDLVTCYRRHHAPRFLRRKPKWRAVTVPGTR